MDKQPMDNKTDDIQIKIEVVELKDNTMQVLDCGVTMMEDNIPFIKDQ